MHESSSREMISNRLSYNSAADHKKENSDMTYFPCTNEYLYEARGGAEGAISSNKYRNTCRKQRRGRREREEEEEKREDNYQVIRI
jgi:hypothetical protein